MLHLLGLLILDTYLGLLLLRLLVGHNLAMLLLGLLLLNAMVVLLLLLLRLDAWPGCGLLLLFIIVTLVFVVVFREVTLRVAKRHIGLALVLLKIDWLVQVIVHNMILGGLLADVVVRGRHADQVDLMEGEALRADPRVLLAILTIVEHLAAQRFIGIVTIERKCY